MASSERGLASGGPWRRPRLLASGWWRVHRHPAAGTWVETVCDREEWVGSGVWSVLAFDGGLPCGVCAMSNHLHHDSEGLWLL